MTEKDWEKKWVEQLQLFMDEYGFNVEWGEWTYDDFTALKDWIQLDLLHENAELRTRVADLELCNKNANALIADQADESQRIVDKLQTRLSTLLKASEGMEKALEAIAGRDVSIPDYDWCDWNGLDATHETSKIIAEFAKQALADFRALKEKNNELGYFSRQ